MTDNKLTMEEILDMNGIGGGHYQYRNETLKSMSEYAQQEAIAFAEWALINNYKPIYWLDNKYWTNDMIIANYKTTEQLYQLFKNRT